MQDPARTEGELTIPSPPENEILEEAESPETHPSMDRRKLLQLHQWWFLSAYVFLFLAAWNAVIRPRADLPITPFYLVSPFVFVALLAKFREFRKWLWPLLGVLFYGFSVGFLYGTPFLMQLNRAIKYLQLFTLLGVLLWLKDRDVNFPTRSLRLVWSLLGAAFVFVVLELFTPFEFPSIVSRDNAYWLNAYFYTPNDLGLFLSACFCLILLTSSNNAVKITLFVSIGALNLRNSARASILAMGLTLLAYSCLVIARRLKMRPVLVFSLVFLVLPFLLFLVAQSKFNLGGTSFSLMELIIEPIRRILVQEPYRSPGSIGDRTDSLIFNLKELQSTWWLGLGLGGSVYVLSKPKYQLATAKSLHNALAEWFVEFGLLFLAIATRVLYHVLRPLGQMELTPSQRGRVILVFTAPLLAVIQSSGFISNYAFWIVVFVICSLPAAKSKAVKMNAEDLVLRTTAE